MNTENSCDCLRQCVCKIGIIQRLVPQIFYLSFSFWQGGGVSKEDGTNRTYSYPKLKYAIQFMCGTRLSFWWGGGID